MNKIQGVHIKMIHPNGKVPMRSTTGSAGYDIFAPDTISLPPKSEVTVRLPFVLEGDIDQIDNVVLMRSSFGIKKRIRLLKKGSFHHDGVNLKLSKPVYEITLFNDNDEAFVIEKDEHFAQLIVMSVNSPNVPFCVKSVEKSKRDNFGRVPKSSFEETTDHSYVFKVDEDLVIPANSQIKVPTGCKSVIEPGTWTGITVNPALTSDVILSNACAVIDYDYQFADNGGHVLLAFNNISDQEVVIPSGTALVEWWTKEYLTVENEESPTTKRTGGIGSTTETKQA